MLPLCVYTTREEIRVAKLSSLSVGCPRCCKPLGERKADVLGDRIDAVEGALGCGRPCMSRTKSCEPSFCLIGLLQIIIPLVAEAF